jgi:hypothetical protein
LAGLCHTAKIFRASRIDHLDYGTSYTPDGPCIVRARCINVHVTDMRMKEASRVSLTSNSLAHSAGQFPKEHALENSLRQILSPVTRILQFLLPRLFLLML